MTNASTARISAPETIARRRVGTFGARRCNSSKNAIGTNANTTQLTHEKWPESTRCRACGSIPMQNRPMMSNRSEERRVGKECRSLCDWSSDVCSSDLNEREHDAADPREVAGVDALQGLRQYPNAEQTHDEQQIGRASCRERV